MPGLVLLVLISVTLLLGRKPSTKDDAFSRSRKHHHFEAEEIYNIVQAIWFL